VRLSGIVIADEKTATISTIAIVADRQLAVAALAAILLREPRYRLLRELDGSDQLAVGFAAYHPEVVILDNACRAWLAEVDPRAWGGRSLLLMDEMDRPDTFVAAARIGVNGYISQAGSAADFALAIDIVRRTGYYLDPLLGEGIFQALRMQDRVPNRNGATLTGHEQDIVVRVAEGRSTKEIARDLEISPKTVANQVAGIARKLNLSHRGGLVLYAARQGLTGRESPTHGTTIPYKVALPVG
jgi:DNA-binding NarL/FixJ family response regulator